jgi:hypothetical protein
LDDLFEASALLESTFDIGQALGLALELVAARLEGLVLLGHRLQVSALDEVEDAEDGEPHGDGTSIDHAPGPKTEVACRHGRSRHAPGALFLIGG